MEQYELEMESGLKLSRQGAQSIVEEVGAVVGQNINMMDRRGYVIASTDETRIGSLHEGARKLIEEHLPELYVEVGHATPTSRPGLNLPITHAGSIVGVIGITGLYGEVVGYGQVVKKMVEILIRENAEQDERRMGQRVLNRFLEDWVIGNGLMQPGILALTLQCPDASWLPAPGSWRNMHPLPQGRSCWSRWSVRPPPLRAGAALCSEAAAGRSSW